MHERLDASLPAANPGDEGDCPHPRGDGHIEEGFARGRGQRLRFRPLEQQVCRRTGRSFGE